MALAYVARFATSEAKLQGYLARKLRERGWDDEGDPDAGPPDPAAIARRMAQAGYVDDRAFAQAKSGSLLRRGYGQRRIGQALAAAGIGADLREDVRADAAAARQAALAMARKRGFGPFGRAVPDRPLREKQIAAMLRAGHSLDMARDLIDAATIEAAEQWADERD